MQAFSLQIDNIVGYDVGASTDVDDALTASAKEVLDILPDALLLLHSTSSDTSSYKLPLLNKKVLSITKDGYNVKSVGLGLSTQIADSNSLHYATERSPVSFINATNDIEVYPQGSSAQGKVSYINYPVVSNSHTEISSNVQTGVTVEADDGVFTKTAHGFVVGNTVTLKSFTIADGTPIAYLNDLTTQIASTPNADTFTLEGITATDVVADGINGQVIKNGGFPNSAEHAVVLSASLKLLNKKLGALIVTDEDTELAQTIQGLIASTSALYQKEIQRLTGAKS
jgi:hypothetical protein